MVFASDKCVGAGNEIAELISTALIFYSIRRLPTLYYIIHSAGGLFKTSKSAM
jgi:hypothetical protein